MSIPLRYVVYQSAVLKGMAATVLSAVKQSARLARAARPELPGPVCRGTAPALPVDLVRDYVRHVGGDPARYPNHVPAHLFPQWALSMTGKLCEGLSYPVLRIMNGGCKLRVNGPLPVGQTLEFTGQLAGVDDNGKRAILDQKFVTGTRENPEAIVAHVYVYVPLSGKGAKGGESREKSGAKPQGKKEKPRIPADAVLLETWTLGARSGLDFAKLTGDFNPLHWVPGWGVALGFGGRILHGFSALARAYEGLCRTRFGGDVEALAEIETKFTRPIVLPARVGLFARGEQFWVGKAAGELACLEGHFKAREEKGGRA